MDYTSGRPLNSLENQTIQNLKVIQINNENVADEVNEQTALLSRVATLESSVNFLTAIINELLDKNIPVL
jgi:hypothetical protein